MNALEQIADELTQIRTLLELLVAGQQETPPETTEQTTCAHLNALEIPSMDLSVCPDCKQVIPSQ